MSILLVDGRKIRYHGEIYFRNTGRSQVGNTRQVIVPEIFHRSVIGTLSIDAVRWSCGQASRLDAIVSLSGLYLCNLIHTNCIVQLCQANSLQQVISLIAKCSAAKS